MSQSIPIFDRALRLMIAHGLRGSNFLAQTIARLCTMDEIAAATRFGSVFRLRPTDYIDWVVLREGYYEREVLDALLEALPQRGVLWDVGANFGLHAITVKLLRPDATVICFEPSPDHAARILRHSEMNCAPVSLMCLGLSNKIGVAPFHVLRRGNPGLSSFNPWPETRYDLRIHCLLDSADNLIESGLVPLPDVVKMDVEGGEIAAVAGMARLFNTTKIRRLIIEDGDNVASVLGDYGFVAKAQLPEKNYVMDRPA
jgi:FkbM family methyltransferase